MQPAWHDTILMVMLSINGGELLDCILPTLRLAPFSAVVLAIGKPVIGTGYSASTDFLNDSTGYPIPYNADPTTSPRLCLCGRRNRAEAAAKTEAVRRLVKQQYDPYRIELTSSSLVLSLA